MQHIFKLSLLLFLLVRVGVAKAQEITVLTYNIYHGEKHYERGKSNLQEIAAVINQYKPDFVALQEVDSMTNRTAGFNEGVRKDLVQELARLTGMHGYFGKAIDYSEGGYGEGILSRYPAQPVVYNLATPAGGEGRAMIVIEHKLRNGKKLVFAGTHFCHEFEENQQAQAKQVADILTGLQLPVVVAGDFNIQPDSKAYALLTAKMQDAAVVSGDPQYTFPFTDPKIRIDYVFLNQGRTWKVKDVKVIRANASDHMPLLVTLRLRK